MFARILAAFTIPISFSTRAAEVIFANFNTFWLYDDNLIFASQPSHPPKLQTKLWPGFSWGSSQNLSVEIVLEV